MKRKERGAYMVMMALLIVVLIGIAALAIDVGRLLLMRTEMQNAVDAAALAAAAELDTNDGARARARTAARTLLTHQARFSREKALLDNTALPDGAFEFYCLIGSESDPDGSEQSVRERFCDTANVPTADGKVVSVSDTVTHYVRVTLDPALLGDDTDYFTADLIFLPVLSVLGIEVDTSVSAVVTALAGRNYFACTFPPMAICDPWEGSGSFFRNEMPVGGAITLRSQGGTGAWAPGNFGFLSPSSGNGADELMRFLADPNLDGCTDNVVETNPGQAAQKTRAGINVRFNDYPSGGGANAMTPDDYPPAPNLYDYWYDDEAGSGWGNGSLITEVGGNRFFDSDWEWYADEDASGDTGYWLSYHSAGSESGAWDNGAGRPSRWEVYQYELDNDLLSADMVISPGEAPDDGDANTPDDADRRLMSIAVLSCDALGVRGSKTITVFPRDGYARMFLLDASKDPGGGGLEFHAEYQGWVFGKGGDNHVQIQLYE